MNEMMLIPMRKLVFVLFCFAFAALPAYAVPQLAEGDMPVKINADDMEYDINRSRVIFTGNVHVVRGAEKFGSETGSGANKSSAGKHASDR